MIRAAIDPGSRWIACTITRDDGPASPCNWVDAKCFIVGRWTPFKPTDPRYHKAKVINDIEVYSPLGAHEATPADRDAAADEVAAYLIAWKVEACDVENVEGVYASTAQAASASAKALIAAAKIVTRALTLWEVWRKSLGFLAPVVLMLAATWRARLVPLIKARMRARGEVPPPGVLIKGKGSALEPVLAEHVPGWPGGASFDKDEVEHIRDSTGLALACGLPALPARKKGAAGPRLRRERRKRQAPPRGSRARAKMGPIDLAKYRATDRARDARYRERDRVKSIEVRAARGCECPWSPPPLRGVHADGCAAGKAMRVALAAACTCREETSTREGKHRASCAIRVTLDKARAAVCSCAVVPRLGKRHRRTCPMHKARVYPA